MANKNLFEQAIIDAKAIREAAIANAKLALEENLTEGVKEMLAEKLKALEEEAIEEEVDMEEETMEEAVEETVAEGEEDSMEEEVVAEADEEELDAEEEPAEEEDMEDDSEEVEDDMEDSEEVESEVEDMTIEDLKDLIRDILAQEMGEEDEDEADMEVDLEEPVDGMEEPADMEGGEEEEVDLEELLSELAEGEVEETVAEGEGEMEEEANDMNLQGNQDVAEGEMEEEVVSESFMEAWDAFSSWMNSTADIATGMSNLEGLVAMLGGAGIPIGALINAARKDKKEAKAKELERIAKEKGISEEGPYESAELDEALETINTLQEELNEVNLLNAKLLYLNKIFKANNLTESQKANTIASFDKAETVKEVKLVFETVSENLTTSATKKPMNEVKGMASKAAGVAPKKPEMIVETSEAVLRMQKLAGIIK